MLIVETRPDERVLEIARLLFPWNRKGPSKRLNLFQVNANHIQLAYLIVTASPAQHPSSSFFSLFLFLDEAHVLRLARTARQDTVNSVMSSTTIYRMRHAPQYPFSSAKRWAVDWHGSEISCHQTRASKLTAATKNSLVCHSSGGFEVIFSVNCL